MAHIVTKTGFEIDMTPDVLDDMEVFELIVEVDKGEATKLPALLGLILTPEQKTALYEHCRTDAGKVPISAVVAEFAQIMEGMRDAEKK